MLLQVQEKNATTLGFLGNVLVLLLLFLLFYLVWTKKKIYFKLLIHRLLLGGVGKGRLGNTVEGKYFNL